MFFLEDLSFCAFQHVLQKMTILGKYVFLMILADFLGKGLEKVGFAKRL